MPGIIPVPPPNDPRHLPRPNQFVSLALASVHPRQGISSKGRSNNRLFGWQPPIPPNPPRCKRVIPFSVSAFLNEPSYYRPRSDPFHCNRTALPRPPPSPRPVSTDHLCPDSLHCHRGAPAESPVPFFTPIDYHRAALLRSPPTIWRKQPLSSSRLR